VRFHEVRDRPLHVEPQEERVLLGERARKESSRERLDAVLLERLQEADADLGSGRDLAQADAAQLTFLPQLVTERAHGFRLLGPHGPQPGDSIAPIRAVSSASH
jgi:hypothetical protein